MNLLRCSGLLGIKKRTRPWSSLPHEIEILILKELCLIPEIEQYGYPTSFYEQKWVWKEWNDNYANILRVCSSWKSTLQRLIATSNPIERVLWKSNEPTSLLALQIWIRKQALTPHTFNHNDPPPAIPGDYPPFSGAGLNDLLIFAVCRGFPTCIALLLSHGADPRITTYRHDLTLLETAVDAHSLPSLTILVNACALPEPVEKAELMFTTALEKTLKWSMPIMVDMADLLLKAGANLSHPGRVAALGCTMYKEPWQYVAATPWNGVGMMRVFRNNGITVLSQRHEERWEKGCHPLELVALHGKVEGLRILLEVGIEMEIEDMREWERMVRETRWVKSDMKRAVREVVYGSNTSSNSSLEKRRGVMGLLGALMGWSQ